MKTAVVTGGGSGIGLAVANRLRADGLEVATIDLRPADADLGFTADVTDRAQVDAALSGIRARLGPVTVLVNAAGLDGFKRFNNITFQGLAAGDRRQPQRGLPHDPGGAARHAGGRVGTHRQYLLVQHAFRCSVHVSLCSGQVRGQRAHQVAGARVRAQRHHGQRRAAGIHRHPDAARRREERGSSATSRRTSPQPRCAGWANRKTSRRRAPS